MAYLALLAAITQVRRIAENRSDSIVMVKKCHYDQGWHCCWAGILTLMFMHVFSLSKQVQREAEWQHWHSVYWKKKKHIDFQLRVYLLMSHLSFGKSAWNLFNYQLQIDKILGVVYCNPILLSLISSTLLLVACLLRIGHGGVPQIPAIQCSFRETAAGTRRVISKMRP